MKHIYLTFTLLLFFYVAMSQENKCIPKINLGGILSGTLPPENIKAQIGLMGTFYNGCKYRRFNIKSYNVVISSGKNEITIPGSGFLFNDNILKALQNIKPADVVKVENIKIKYFDDTKDISVDSISIIIIEYTPELIDSIWIINPETSEELLKIIK